MKNALQINQDMLSYKYERREVMNVQDLTSAVVLGYTSWKWYHEWKDRKKKERFQAKRRKHKARNRSFE